MSWNSEVITNYYSFANKFKGTDLTIYIENKSDESFWSFIFNQISDNLKLNFISHSRDEKQSSGKKEVLKYKDSLNKNSIICIDSDYDYILNKNGINSNPNIFQTYTYAVENYSCCAKSLNNLLRDLNIKVNFDFDEFFRDYSKVIREVFLYDLYLCNEKTNLKHLFRIDENLNYEDNGKSIIESIKEKFKIKKEQLDRKYTINQNELFNLNQKLKDDDLIKDNYLHLYIDAHILFDSIKNLLKKFLNINFKSEMENIKGQFDNNKTIRKIKIDELNNKKLCAYTALKLNFKECFYNNYCPSMKKIKDEIKDFLEKNSIL